MSKIYVWLLVLIVVLFVTFDASAQVDVSDGPTPTNEAVFLQVTPVEPEVDELSSPSESDEDSLPEIVQQMLMMILEPLAGAVIVTIMLLIARLLNTVEVKARSIIEDELESRIERVLASLITTAVREAEQVGLTGQLKDLANERKAMAVKMVQDALNSRGLTHISALEISARIERAILEGWHKVTQVNNPS